MSVHAPDAARGAAGTYHPAPRCRGCHAPSGGFEVALAMDPMPLAGVFCPSAGAARGAAVYPLTWVRCGTCGLVQVLEDVQDEVLFTEYNYASSTVPGLVRHFEGYAEFLRGRYAGAPVRGFLEIGCNDGVLLSRLPAEWQLRGVDPSDVAGRAAAAQRHYALHNAPFTEAVVRGEGLEGSLSAVSGSNCLAHISDLRAVFEAVHLALRPGGHFWVEVHDLDALLAGAQWDTIYHEHKAEWSERSLRHCMAALGFGVREVHRLPLHGGLLRVCFEKGRAAAPAGDAAAAEREGLAALRRSYERRHDTAAARTLRDAAARGQDIAAYGASGRANVYLNQLPELPFAFIVDESPLRRGKFIPAVGTPVVGPEVLAERAPAHCLVTAWNYSDDIVAKNTRYAGEWLTAFGAE